jgi:hypothetical protein
VLLTKSSDGEGVNVPIRHRLTDDDLKRGRALQMYLMRIKGHSVSEIAMFFSFTRDYIYKELRSIPDAEKRNISGRHHRGQVA